MQPSALNRLLHQDLDGCNLKPKLLAIIAIASMLLNGDHGAPRYCLAAEPRSDEKPPFSNHLINESSPYLLQHAHNPVQWYPWGQEAFDRARKENKPIFLSIGYSTCYWCHVMERESFEDESVAKLLADNFIAIKVDREERPEVDEQYMQATEALIGSGGWPNSLWLTPDRKPFLAATYIPKPRLKKMLTQIASTWKESPSLVKREANQLTEAIRASGRHKPVLGAALDQRVIDQELAELTRRFDSQHGGFGRAPKFPPHGRLLLLVEEYRRGGDQRLLRMVTGTLDAMADGGIHDQIGGGFHRYSTDASWFVPHFEKMLSDNAQLLRLYTDAYLLTKNPRYRRVVQDIAEWVKREMTDPQGGFYTALDAESEGEEGKFYVWKYDALLQALGDADGRLFANAYGAQPGGNWIEQRTGRNPGTNILVRRRIQESNASNANESHDKLESKLALLGSKLLAARNLRPSPRRDDKVLAVSNGLMIESLAYAGRTLEEPELTAAAEKGASFIFREMWKDDRLLHTWRNGQSRIPGYLDDYAYLGRGLLELEDATNDDRWGTRAQQLAEAMIKQFEDAEGGAFFFTPAGEDVPLMRSKNLLGGGNMPCANGVAVELLLRLADRRHLPAYRETANRALSSLAGFAAQETSGDESLLLATAYQLRTRKATNQVESKPSAAAATKPDAEMHEPPVTVRLYGSKSVVHPGQSFRLVVDFEIEPRWHLYAPSTSKTIRPATVEMRKNERASVVVVRMPAGRVMKDPAVAEEVRILEGVAEYELTVTIAEHAPDGLIELMFDIQTQACNDHICLEPRKTVIRLPITIARAP